MAISFVNMGTKGAGGNTATSASCGAPSGLATGDIVYVVVCSGSAQAYETVQDNNGNSLTEIHQTADTDLTGGVFWYRVPGTVPTSFTCDRGAGGGQLLCVAYAFRGCISSGTPHEDATQNTAGVATADTTPQSSLITTTSTNRVAVCFAVVDDDPDYSSGNPPSGPPAWSDAGGVNDTTGSDARIDAIYRDVASAGDVAAVTVGTLPGADFWWTETLALIPEAGETITPTGSQTPDGALTKEIGKAVAGTATPDGALARAASLHRTVEGTATPDGALTKKIGKYLGQYQPTLSNGGFESGALSPWVDPSSSNLFIEGTTVRTGSFSLRSEWVATDTNMGRQDVTLPAAGRYLVSGWVYIPSSWSGTGAPSINIELAGTGDTLVAFQNALNATRDSWQFFWRVYDISSDDLAVALVLRSAGTTAGHVAGQALYFDDIAFEALSLFPTGELTKSTKKAFSGDLGPAGTLSRVAALSRGVSGDLGPSGEITKKVGKSLAGDLGPDGALTTRIVKAVSPTGTITPDGSLTKKVTKALEGTVTPDGALATEFTPGGLAVEGQITPDGALTLVSAFTRTLSGQVAPAGTLSLKVSRAFSGSVTPDGSLSKKVSKAVAGSLSPDGALTEATSFVRTLEGQIAPAGSLSNVITEGGLSAQGTITPAGVLSFKYKKSLAGTITPTGLLCFKLPLVPLTPGSIVLGTPTGPSFTLSVLTVEGSPEYPGEDEYPGDDEYPGGGPGVADLDPEGGTLGTPDSGGLVLTPIDTCY